MRMFVSDYRKHIKGLIILGLLAAPGVGFAEGQIAYLAVADGVWQVWVSDDEGSKPRQVTQSQAEKTRVSWFPSGKEVLVNTSDGRVLRVDIASGYEGEIDLPIKGMLDAVLSPSGDYLAFSYTAAAEGPPSGDSNDLYIVGLDGTGMRRLARLSGLQVEPSWSHDGKAVYYFSSSPTGDHDIWMITIDGNVRRQITSRGRYHLDVAISSQGDLAYSSNRSGNFEVWVQDKAGQRTRVTDHSAVDAHPTWSPDGSEILFESSRTGNFNLWRVAKEGGKAKQITHSSMGARNPSWWNPPGERE